MLAFHRGNYQEAVELIGRGYSKYWPTVHTPLRYGDLYYGVARIMMQPTLSKEEQKTNRQAIVGIKKGLQRFALLSPLTYLNKWHLLEAEFARLEGKHERAEHFYESAILAARDQGFIQEEALASELAGRYWQARGVERIARVYLREAWGLYDRWGAARKARWLEEQYPRLRLAARQTAGSSNGTIDASTSMTIDGVAGLNFDTQALMRALKSITEENVHSQIISKTMSTVMQFAGAERTMLLLRGSEDSLLIEADMEANGTGLELLTSIPFEQSERLSQAVVNYAKRIKGHVVIHDAQESQSVIPGLANDPYIQANAVRSILCIPFTAGVGNEAELIGLLYVENRQSSHAFTDRRVGTLEIICLAAAGRLELSRKAITDSLTGLYNRGYFDNALRQELLLARRKERPVSLVMVDIDYFKKFNDQWGHQLGDMVLRHVAQILKDACRDSDIVVRYGGEEMAVILPEAAVENAFEVAQRIRQMIEERPLVHQGNALKVTASLGVAIATQEMLTPEMLIDAADQALYRSKKDGRNRVTLA
jgi:diguanylate cyclase (GGDEF)-like protein